MTARRSPIAVAAALSLALAFAAAGCGGGSSDGNGTGNAGKQLSHRDLAAQANTACTKASAAIAKVPAATSVSGLAAYAGSVRAIGESLHADLSKLTPTMADRATFEQYLDGLKTSNRALASMKAAAAKSDDDGVRTAASTIAGTDVGVLAARAGFGSCATATKTPGS
jgi:hypothetical protein